jgi:small-conductance mechanosensitive channel
VEALTTRTRNDVDDLLAHLLRRTSGLFVLLISLWAASATLSLSAVAEGRMRSLVVIGFALQAAFWGSAVVAFFIDRYRERQIRIDPGSATAIGALSFVGRGLVWLLAVLLVLDNLGIDVTALVTGLGIGGLAVALALQNVLSDLFASLAIVLDKPFVVGDFLVVGDAMGSVEYVGLKTTRLRALSGEQIVLSNSDLLASRIRNYQRMSERRVVFQLGVTYDTPNAALAGIPAMVRDIVEGHPHTRFDRCHFKAYGASSLDFETVFYMLTSDYNAYMDVQQAINLEILARFRAEHIEFAFPTRTVFATLGRERRAEAEPVARGGATEPAAG